MSDRPAPASQPRHGTATVSIPEQRPPQSWRRSEVRSTRSAVPPLPPGPLYPDIPRQWSGPVHESFPPQWSGPAPAGLDAPLPVPRTHPVRNTIIGVIAALVTLGGLVSSIGLVTSTGLRGTAIDAWQENGGLHRVNALVHDLEAAEEAAKAHDLDGVDRACRSLHSDAEAAQAYPPIPDPEAQTRWAATLAYLAHGSAACVTAIHNGDADLFAEASSEMGAAPEDMTVVVNRLLALNR